MTGCLKRGMNCARIYFDTCFEVQNQPTIDCLIKESDDSACVQTNGKYITGNTTEDYPNAISQFFNNTQIEVEKQIQFCGHYLYGDTFRMHFKFTKAGQDAQKAEMKYNSIFFSYQSLLQISIITCKSGPFPPFYGSEFEGYEDDQNYNLLIKICQEYFRYNYQYKKVPGGYRTRDIVLVLMQGIQPFKYKAVQFVDYMPHTQIHKFYKCLNSDKTNLEFLNQTRYPEEVLYPPVKLNKYEYENINLCKPKCAAILDWQTNEFKTSRKTPPDDTCWERKSAADHGKCWKKREDFCFILGPDPDPF